MVTKKTMDKIDRLEDTAHHIFIMLVENCKFSEVEKFIPIMHFIQNENMRAFNKRYL